MSTTKKVATVKKATAEKVVKKIVPTSEKSVLEVNFLSIAAERTPCII